MFPPSIGDLHLFLAAKRWVAGDQEKGYGEKKKSVLTPLTHTRTHRYRRKNTPPNTRWCFWNLFPFFHDQKKRKKKTTPKKHAFCILGYRSIQPPLLRSRKDEYQVRHDSENFINKLMIAAWRTRKQTSRKKVRRTAKMRVFG